MKGIIYIMTTAVSGLIKIGQTGNANFQERMRFLEANGYYNVSGLKRFFAIELDDYNDKENLLKEIFNKQNRHWEDTFASKPQMFGTDPSIAAIKAVAIFKNNGVRKILELGGGQGRDTLYFAQQGLEVTVSEYTAAGI